MRKNIARAACVFLLCLLLPALALGAVIDNGSDPGSRLNLRGAPSRQGDTLGKFVSGTPVEILADAGEGWAKVRIGSGPHAITGYMMREYLKDSCEIDARQGRRVVSPYGTPAVVLRDRPSDSFDAVAMLPVGTGVTVIGGSGSFAFVMTGDGAVGCLENGELK